MKGRSFLLAAVLCGLTLVIMAFSVGPANANEISYVYTINVVKMTEPVDDTQFGFTFGNDSSIIEQFILTGDPSNNRKIFSNLNWGTYTITETAVPSEWELIAIQVDSPPPPPGGVSVNLDEQQVSITIPRLPLNIETTVTFRNVVPIPSTALLFGSGLIGLIGLKRRLRQ